jgi:type II secretory pathway pseudopilin PulG
MRRNDSGFTLFESASVLLIMGLLLAGVVRGQEAINTAQARKLVEGFTTTRIALLSYQDRFRALPGDHGAVQSIFANASRAVSPAGAIGNGRIDGTWNSAISTDESYLFWQHVRLAGMVGGATDLSDTSFPPQSVLGTRLGISGTMQITQPTPMTGTHNVCTDGVPGTLAKRVDVYLDDGNPQTGSVRIADTAAPNTALAPGSVNDSAHYIVCYAF